MPSCILIFHFPKTFKRVTVGKKIFTAEDYVRTWEALGYNVGSRRSQARWLLTVENGAEVVPWIHSHRGTPG